MDIAGASFALILLAPIMFLLSYLVRRKHGTPFSSDRNVRVNMAILFRWSNRRMKDEHSDDGELFLDANRLKAFGQSLRSSSLDELPELWNVLKGYMSLVGPRPVLMEYLPLYSNYQMRRQDVRPGISGWAQINARNALSWKEESDLDVGMLRIVLFGWI